MRKQIALGSVIAFGLASQAFAAEGLSYNNVDLAFVHTKLSLDGGEGSASGDGFSLGGSAAFGESFFGFASLGSVDFDGGKLKPLTLGVGFHTALSDSLDLVSGVSFERLKISADGFGSGSESGYGISVGLRGIAGESFEWTGGLKYQDIGDFEDALAFNVGGRYHFTETLSAGVDFTRASFGDLDFKLSTWTVSLRYDFGG